MSGCIERCLGMKEGTDFVRAARHMSQCADGLGLEFGEREDGRAAESVPLDLSPYPFVGIQFRAVRRQQEQVYWFSLKWTTANCR